MKKFIVYKITCKINNKMYVGQTTQTLKQRFSRHMGYQKDEHNTKFYRAVRKYGAENFPGLTVGAKTGTGEVDGGKKPNAMFTGFVENENLPLAFVVCVEDAGYGKTVCVPIVSKVLSAVQQALK